MSHGVEMEFSTLNMNNAMELRESLQDSHVLPHVRSQVLQHVSISLHLSRYEMHHFRPMSHVLRKMRRVSLSTVEMVRQSTVRTEHVPTHNQERIRQCVESMVLSPTITVKNQSPSQHLQHRQPTLTSVSKNMLSEKMYLLL